MALSSDTRPHFTTIAEFASSMEKEVLGLFRDVLLICDKIKKISQWLDDNDDKPGKTGKPRKSNITDNDSAKMKSSHGVIQGYDGVAAVDSKHQIIVHAQAYGRPQEHDLLDPVIEQTRQNFKAIDDPNDVFGKTKLTADEGFHTEANMKLLAAKNIDGYVADTQFRKRDPHFAERDRYKQRYRQERAKKQGRSNLFTVKDFTFAEDKSHCICPAGKRLYRNGAFDYYLSYRLVRPQCNSEKKWNIP